MSKSLEAVLGPAFGVGKTFKAVVAKKARAGSSGAGGCAGAQYSSGNRNVVTLRSASVMIQRVLSPKLAGLRGINRVGGEDTVADSNGMPVACLTKVNYF
jgi:hypothetical protein